MKSLCLQKHFSRKILTSLIGTLSISLLPATALAQIGSASVQGVIAAQTLPQPGLEVVVRNIDNGYSFRATTQKDGSYIFKGLAPGRYQVFLQEKTGKASQSLVLKVGQAATLNFELEKPVTEKVDEIVVIGSQLKNTSNGGEIGTNVSLEQISKLPQNTRNFLAFADLAPGVQFNQASDGSTSIKGGAQTPEAINVFIDGVGQKNYVLKGGITGQDSSRGNPFPQSAISQYKVITQNYSAEYDQLSSAAIVAVTASGSNEFHGGIFGDYSDEGMRKLRPSEFATQKKVPSEQQQFGIHLGGPIIQDKMHFFFAYEGKNNTDPKDVIPEGGFNQGNLPAQFQSEIGGRSAEFKEDLYFGKLGYLISEQQKIELTAKVRKENELTNIGGIQSASFATDKKNDEMRIDLSHNWRTDRWVNDTHWTYEDASYNPRPRTIANGMKLTNGAGQAVLNLGGGENYQDKGQYGWSIQEDFSFLAISDHVLKTGIKYKSIKLNATQQEPFNPQFHYNIGYDASATTPYRVKWGAPLAGIGDGSVEAENWQLGLYVQDDWTLSDRLTVNIGLRWDYEESDSYLDYRTPADVRAGIENWVGIKNSEININDYISDGDNRDSFKDAWQPRLGFVYDISDENDLAIFGGAGRAYDRNLFDNLQLEATKATFPTYERNFITGNPLDPCSSGCIAWDPVYLTRQGLAQLETEDKGANREVYMVNNNLKTPYSDQFSLGIRGSLEDWKAEVSLSHVASKDGFVWLLANRFNDGNFFKPGETWGPPWGNNGIPGFGSTIIGTNGLQTKTNSLFIKLDKPKEETDWGLTLAYTYSQAKTNREIGEVFAFDYPSLEWYGMHDANKIPKHRLVVSSVFSLPMDIDFSAKLNVNRGTTYYGTDCRAGWAHCKFNQYEPDRWFKQLDIAFSKNIATGMWVEGSNLTVRLDVLNLWNNLNPDGYNTWFGGAEENLPADFGKRNDSIAGPMRTVKFGLNWNW